MKCGGGGINKYRYKTCILYGIFFSERRATIPSIRRSKPYRKKTCVHAKQQTAPPVCQSAGDIYARLGLSARVQTQPGVFSIDTSSNSRQQTDLPEGRPTTQDTAGVPHSCSVDAPRLPRRQRLLKACSPQPKCNPRGGHLTIPCYCGKLAPYLVEHQQRPHALRPRLSKHCVCLSAHTLVYRSTANPATYREGR